MTAQVPEILLYEGEELSMCAEPLGGYFTLTGLEPNFRSNCTALWRGYVGTWEISEGRLYLVRLQGTTNQDEEVSLATLFPDFPDRVFAGIVRANSFTLPKRHNRISRPLIFLHFSGSI